MSFLIDNYSATVTVEVNLVGSSFIRILDPLEVDGFIALAQYSRNIVRFIFVCMCVFMEVGKHMLYVQSLIFWVVCLCLQADVNVCMYAYM